MNESTKKILAVDDDPNLLFGLSSILKRAGYQVHTANNGETGLAIATTEHPDLIVCDVRMPVMGGFEMLQRLRWNACTADIPFIFLTATGEQESVLKGFANGADDYIVKPFEPPNFLARVSAVLRRVVTAQQNIRQTSDEHLRRLILTAPYGMILTDQAGTIRLANGAMQEILGATALAGTSLYAFLPKAWHAAARQYLTGEVELPNGAIAFEGEMFRLNGTAFPAQISAVLLRLQGNTEARFMIRDLSTQLQTEADLEQARNDLLNAYEATLSGWARTLELRDHETQGHSERVAQLTVAVARTLGVAEDAIVHIRRGALLHDIGKLGIPDSILFKPGALTVEEWAIMRKHPQHAYSLLADIDYLRPALDIPYCHHEKWDGSGYPRGLKGEEIPLAARIFAVVDVWDALTSERPYRKEWTREATLEYIQNWSGTHFDPMVVDVALQVLKAHH